MFGFISDMPGLLAVLAFLAIFLFCIGVSQGFRQRSVRREIVRKIQSAGEYHRDKEDASAAESMEEKGANPLLSVFARVGGKLPPAKSGDYSQTSRIRFLRAGYRNPNALSVFWGFKIILSFALTAGFAILRFYTLSAASNQVTVVLMVLSALLGFYLPDIWIKQKADTRREKILLALPDALDLMVICVEAGIGLDAAIQRVAQEIEFSCLELSDELNFTTLELRAGKTRVDALRNLALRTNLTEINSLVTLLVQTDKFGTSMANALRVYADTYRTERYQKAEELAAKLPVKLLFPLAVFIFPSLFVVLLGPAAISIYKALIVK